MFIRIELLEAVDVRIIVVPVVHETVTNVPIVLIIGVEAVCFFSSVVVGTFVVRTTVVHAGAEFFISIGVVETLFVRTIVFPAIVVFPQPVVEHGLLIVVIVLIVIRIRVVVLIVVVAVPGIIIITISVVVVQAGAVVVLVIVDVLIVVNDNLIAAGAINGSLGLGSKGRGGKEQSDEGFHQLLL